MEKLLVIGRGASGDAAMELAAALKIAAVQAVDAPDNDPGKILEGITEVIVSPGVREGSALLQAAESRRLPIWSELEFGARHFPGKMLAVTGTNGKTTTVELTTALLKALEIPVEYAGNIGVPLSHLAAQIRQGELAPDTAAVVEVSSFQLERVRDFAPLAAVLLNVASDHLDRYHGSLAEYRAVKERIFRHVPPENRLYGRTMPESAFPLPRFRCEGSRLFYGAEAWCDLADTALNAAHNHENVLAALELVSRLAEPRQAPLVAALQAFRLGQHRITEVLRRDGVRYVDDSKATNPSAVVAALKALLPVPERRVVLLAGGLDKGMDFTELNGTAPWLKAVLLFGQSAQKLEAVYAGKVADVRTMETMEQAVAIAKTLAVPGDVVLLSPACASMDQFKDYKERGDRFAALVR